MKKIIYAFALLTAVALTGCGGETAESVSKQWCEMTAKIDKAEGEEREKLVTERREFENKIEEKYKGNEDFMKKLDELTRACDN
jgi:PBP1b-binding outer membrane lipoprotein LpoB